MSFTRLLRLLTLSGLLAFSAGFGDENRNPIGDEVNSSVPTEETSDGGSAMPTRATNQRTEQRNTTQDGPMVELEEVRVREPLGPDPAPLLDDPLILKTEKERQRELVRRHMDLAAQLLNRWTIPLITKSLGEQAEEQQRQADLEAFQARQERDLQALREMDESYYKVRKTEYYDTVLQARDRFPPPPRQ